MDTVILKSYFENQGSFKFVFALPRHTDPGGQGGFHDMDSRLHSRFDQIIFTWPHLNQCKDCVVHPYGSIPSGYHLASEDQVEEHKDWILETLEKWAIAKFDTGYESIFSCSGFGSFMRQGSLLISKLEFF